ncbi:MAG: efflux RND transporter permease subunit [Prevotella sp.]
MLRTLLHRPIAVSMVLIAIVAVGILSFAYIPVSLMPEIDIPRITVQMSSPGASVTEVEQQLVAPMRNQLSQVVGLKDIVTESRMDAGTIILSFEPGNDMDLLFIDVNEKIDRAMNNMPKEMQRPKVIKASAMDIPAFYVDITRSSSGNRQADEDDTGIAQLSRLVRNVIVKRIEQLPQTAMVDYSGTVGSEVWLQPDMDKLHALNMSTDDIERAIQDNNIVLEALSVVSGIYRYSIHFDSQILTTEDIENVYIRHEGRLFQLKDFCTVTEKAAVRNGIVRNNGEDAITVAVIKQNDAQMDELRKSMASLMEEMERDYPELEFKITRDQTLLLDYSLSNLEWNLVLGALLACVILFLFGGGWRTPLLIIISIPLSLILTLLSFYVMGISLNVISLSGLILGVGMIVDNAIIVIDNINQRGEVIAGTREVFMPMLSSVLTTCSVFIPLVFISGTAGALFYDQAMGVTIALFASLIVASVVVPVYYHQLFKRYRKQATTGKAENVLLRIYEPMMYWTLRHGRLVVSCLAAAVLFIVVVFPYVKKEKMPDIDHEDALMTIDWNKGISGKENDLRTQELLSVARKYLETTTSMVGTQEFILSHTKDITTNESVVYMKASSKEQLDSATAAISRYAVAHYPMAKVEFGISGNVYDIIFQTDEPDLEIRLQREEGGRPSVEDARSFTEKLRKAYPHLDIPPVSTEDNLQYIANPEKLAFYQVGYQQLYRRLKELVGSSKIYEMSSGSQSIPVIVGQDNREEEIVMQSSIVNREGVDIPLTYLVDSRKTENYKRLSSSSEGEYYPVKIDKVSDDDIRSIMDNTDLLDDDSVKASYCGSYFESRAMIKELSIVLIVAVLLLYFILAAQFESLLQPIIILTEIVIDISVVLLVLWVSGESLNIMSMIGLVVMSGIIINDSILKIDTINRMFRSGTGLLKSVVVSGHRRLKPIIMTSLTTILALLPFLHKGDMGSALQFPLSLTLIVGMAVGTMVSLFFIPLVYYLIYRVRK